MLDKTLTIILAGGAGSRLQPLTVDRAKPAVPFGGKYRIIDFTLSNCQHSGLRQILVLTQYKSHSLQKHLRDAWSIYNPMLGEYITPVPPQMRTDESWYVGTADAIYQNLYLLERSGADSVVILSGDHVYRMDYAAMMQLHRARRADATVACMIVPRAEASSFGVMSIDAQSRITAFVEKPPKPEPMPGAADKSLASMGIYVFSLELLCKILREDHRLRSSAHDFGKDIFPRLIASHDVYAYPFGGEAGRVTRDCYWRDVGTIDAYYDANMDLLRPEPPLDLYQPDWRIGAFEGRNPPARTVPGPDGQEAEVLNSMLCSGAVIAGAKVQHSILSPNVRVQSGAAIENSILFDDVVVGAGSRLKNCIVDKQVAIPPNTVIGHDAYQDRQRFTVSEAGIAVVPRAFEFAGKSADRPTSRGAVGPFQ